MPHADQPEPEAEAIPLPGVSEAYVSRETKDRLNLFADVLCRWAKVINLISKRDQGLVQSYHVPQSVQLASLLPPTVARAIDLGSGGGLPALPLAIVSNVAFELIEADQRKAAFLQEAARITAAPIQVHCCRIERSTVAPAGLVTARALAPLSKLLEYAQPHLAPDGICMFPKGAGAVTEIQNARKQWRFSCRRYASASNPELVVLVIGDVRHVL